jgi:hypothetical protein
MLTCQEKNAKLRSMARKVQLDAFDVRESFAKNPRGCIAHPTKRSILWEQDFGWRPWVRLEKADRRAESTIETPARWEEKYWNSLSGYLEEVVGDGRLGARFADFLVGYLLVVESEYVHMAPAVNSFKEAVATMDGDSKHKSSGRAMRPLRPILGSPATSRPEHCESLKLVLTRIMVADLVRSGFSRKLACEERLPGIWETIAVKVNPKTILRTERRSRKRIAGSK